MMICSECKKPSTGGVFGFGMKRPSVEHHDTSNPKYIVCEDCWEVLK